jgi:hypothetical protein
MNVSNLLFPAVMVVLGVVYEVMAIGMPRGTLGHPGPGLFPMIVGAFWLATASGCLLREVRRPKTASAVSSQAPEVSNAPLGKTLQLMGLMVAYVLALQPVGFPVSICMFLLLAIRIFGYRKWGSAFGMAVVLTAVSYAAFVLWLKVPLPLGLLEDVLD